MPRSLTVLLLALIATVVLSSPVLAEHRLGLGLHYWRTMDDLASEGFDDLKDSGVSGVVSYQWLPKGLLGLELAVEVFPDGFGGVSGTAAAPQVYVLVGKSLYGAVGIGVTLASGFDNNVSEPFYLGRLGWAFHLLPRLILDVNASYRANAWDALGTISTNTITLAGIVRFGF